MQLAFANSEAIKTVTIDGTQSQMQEQLDTVIQTGTEWRDVEVPDTCYRTETRTIPRTCHREETTTVEGTCYRTEVNRECTVVQPRRCVRRCRFFRWGCRRVCYSEQTHCRNVPQRVAYSCPQTETRRIPYNCDHTIQRDVAYDCTRTERREVPVNNLKTRHFFYFQINLGNHGEFNEQLELRVKDNEISVKQVSPDRFNLEILPISSRPETVNNIKVIHHDVIIEVVPRE